MKPNRPSTPPKLDSPRPIVGRERPEALEPWEESGFFRAAIEAHEDGFWVLDSKTRRVVFVNAAVRDKWGVADELLADPRLLLDRVVREERRETLDQIKTGMANGVIDLRTTVRDRDGVPRRVHISGAYEIWPGSGRPLFTGWIRDLTHESELAALVESYRTAAETDSLTGVANRRGLEARMQRDLAQLESESAAILIDLDDFKAINEEHGHFFGDRVLEIAAQRLEATLRPSDLFGRIGGDEFLCVLPGFDSRAGYEVAQRMRRALHNASVRVEDSAIPIRASFALTVLEPDAEPKVDVALHKVRNLMNRAKRLGKDGVAGEGS